MSNEIAKLLLEKAETFLKRADAVKAALALGMPLREIEAYLDWLDQCRAQSAATMAASKTMAAPKSVAASTTAVTPTALRVPTVIPTALPVPVAPAPTSLARRTGS